MVALLGTPPSRWLVLSYAIKDLLRNPRRTLSAFAGVALAVALVSATAFFVDASAARMTERALAPVAIDMQAEVSAPLTSPLHLTETVDGGPSLSAGQSTTITLIAVNGSARTATNVVIGDQPAQAFAYKPGSTTVDGRPEPDREGNSPLISGIRIASMAPGAKVTVIYGVDVSTAVATTQALAPQATISSAEEPGPAIANGPQALSLAQLSDRVVKIDGIKSADPLGTVDFGAGTVRAGSTVLKDSVRVVAVNPDYLQHYGFIRLSTGNYAPGSALLSPEAAAALGASSGQTLALTIPGRTAPLTFPVGGIADLSQAEPLFASRSPDAQGEFAPIPNVIIVPVSTFENDILPAIRTDAASATPLTKAPPYLELDLHVDKARLNSDPTVAAVITLGLKRSIERVAPGQVNVIDNLSDTLNAATGDAILAKILFLFLGLPGVVLAAYLSRYSGSLLAQAQRRERATLRARGAQPRHLVSVLTYTTVGVAVLGAIVGQGLGAAAVVVMLGWNAVTTASPESLLISAALSVAAGIATTALALYIPGRRALNRETNQERSELEVADAPFWLRLRLDFILLAAAALVWIVTELAGGFKPTSAEGQSVSLSFYTLLAPLLGWLGATLLGVRLLLVVSGRLSRRRSRGFRGAASGILRRSIERRPLALASGVIAVALAVAFGSSLALLVATYEAEKLADARFVVGGDVRVTPSIAVPVSTTFGSQLRVQGVTAVTPIAQTSSALVGTDKRAMVAIEPGTFAQVATLNDTFFSGISSAAAMSALKNDPAAVLISTEMARTFNVQAGDQVRAQLPGPADKPVAVTFHAAGLFKDFPGYSQGIDLVGNLQFFQTVTGSTRADFFLIRTADGGTDGVTRVAQLLRSSGSRSNPILVETTTTAFNRDASSLTAVNMRGLGSIETLFAVLMSGIGIAIFVYGLLLQRRKEYVTMRALGMRFGQLRALVLGEASAVAVCSLVVGGVVGVAMALMFVRVLAPLFTIPPSSLTIPVEELALLATLVLGGMGLSALLSGRNLNRLSPMEVLREE
jgi:putative ABC transport system permease protein